MHEDKIIQYSKSLKIVNVECLSKGTGCKYLLCILGLNDELVAKQWRRSIPYCLNNIERIIEFKKEGIK